MFMEKVSEKQKLVLLGATITLIALALRLFSNVQIVVKILTSFQIGIGLGLMWATIFVMKLEERLCK